MLRARGEMAEHHMSSSYFCMIAGLGLSHVPLERTRAMSLFFILFFVLIFGICDFGILQIRCFVDLLIFFFFIGGGDDYYSYYFFAVLFLLLL